MGILGRLVGAAVGKAIEKAYKFGKLNGLTDPLPVKYTDAEGDHYVSIVLADEKKLGKGPTMIVAGDAKEKYAKEFEDSMIHGIGEGYKTVLESRSAKDIQKGKFKILEENLPPSGFPEVTELGKVWGALLCSYRYFREDLGKSFKGVKYYPDDLKKKLPVAKNSYQGEYVLKWEKNNKEYGAPLEGIGRMWYRVKLINNEELAEMSKSFYPIYTGERTKERKKALEEFQKAIKGYIKGIIEGKI